MTYLTRARGDAATSVVLEELRAGLGELPSGRAIELCDVQPSILPEALNAPVGAKAKRQFQLRWFARLLAAMPRARAYRMLRPLAELCGLDLAFKKTKTDREERDALERALLEFGDLGRKKRDEVLR